MARGWESKSIESQIDEAELRKNQRKERVLSPEELEHSRAYESLQLSRTRVLDDLQTAANPKYRELLMKALRFLDDKLAALGTGINTPDHHE